MLTIALTFVLAQSTLGEAGESCRSTSDCAAPLTCLASMCSADPAPAAEPVPAVPEPAPAPVTASSGAPESEPEPSGAFSTIRGFAGIRAGVGPSVTSTEHWAADRSVNFQGVSVAIPVELRAGVLFGRFELAIEGAPATSFLTQTTTAPICLSVGVMVKLHESPEFGLYLPLRARGGASFQIAPWFNGGLTGGGSLGLGLRLGSLLVELRAGADVTVMATASLLSVPVTLGTTWVF